MANIEEMDQLRIQRIQNFKNVITGNGKIDHIPHFGNYWSWKYYDAGYKLSEALVDYDKMADAMAQFFGRYPMDVCFEMGFRNPVKVAQHLGRDNDYIFDDRNYSISIKDQCVIEDEDYDKLIANPEKFLWESFLPKKYSVFTQEGNSIAFQEFISRFMEFGATLGRIVGIAGQYGMPSFADPNDPTGATSFGYELLFSSLRGMKKLARDIRRMPDKVWAACEALDSVVFNPSLERFRSGAMGSNPNTMVDMNPVMLGHIMLNPKQFEKFYWPYLQKIAQTAEEKDKLVFLFAEGSIAPYLEFFQELPKNRFAILSELDDVYEMKRALPNCVIAGGPGTDLLGGGTPEENIMYAQKLITEIGGNDHRFIFAPGKMISFPHDCKRENLSAICQYLESIHY